MSLFFKYICQDGRLSPAKRTYVDNPLYIMSKENTAFGPTSWTARILTYFTNHILFFSDQSTRHFRQFKAEKKKNNKNLAKLNSGLNKNPNCYG